MSRGGGEQLRHQCGAAERTRIQGNVEAGQVLHGRDDFRPAREVPLGRGTWNQPSLGGNTVALSHIKEHIHLLAVPLARHGAPHPGGIQDVGVEEAPHLVVPPSIASTGLPVLVIECGSG